MIRNINLVARASWALMAMVLMSGSLFAQSAVTRPATENSSPRTIPSVAPEQVGLSLKRFGRIDSHIQGYIDRQEAAGALALIARRGKIAYVKTWGDMDREAGQEMSDDAIFRIYSMSKPITTAAVMMLMEEGHFFLNDPIAKFMPEFAEMKVQTDTVDPETGEVSFETKPATRPITVRDLLRHTAGFTYGIFGDTTVDQEYRDADILVTSATLAETTRRLSRIPLLYEPGTQWHYSVSVDVAGRLVEVISGQPFDEFLRERLFEPIGMVDTGFRVPSEKRDRFATLYTPQGTTFDKRGFLTAPQSKEIVPAEPSKDLGDFDEGTKFFSGGGGLVSTASDYWRFCQMLLNGGEFNGVRVLSRKSVELMTADHMTGIAGYSAGGSTFGLGFGVVKDIGQTAKLGSPGTYDWGGAAGTKFWIDPEEQLIGIFMVQILPHQTRMGEEFRQLTYQAIAD